MLNIYIYEYRVKILTKKGYFPDFPSHFCHRWYQIEHFIKSITWNNVVLSKKNKKIFATWATLVIYIYIIHNIHDNTYYISFLHPEKYIVWVWFGSVLELCTICIEGYKWCRRGYKSDVSIATPTLIYYKFSYKYEI